MTSRQWMWLWMWLLLFFIIFCVWNKLQTLTTDNLNAPATSLAAPAVAAAPQIANTITEEVIQKKEEVKKPKDINFKIIKDEESIEISGVFSSQEDVDALKEAYGKISNNVKEGTIIIDENAQNSDLYGALATLNNDFSKFKSGYLEYEGDKFTIDGIVDDEAVKTALADKLQAIDGLKVDNKITVEEKKEEPKVEAIPVKEEPKAEPKGPSKEEIQAKLNNLLKIKKVEFVYASDKLTASGKKTIDEVFAVLNEYKEVNVEVGGHTDSRGSAKMNQALSQKRANSIKKYLISKGIDSKRLKAVGYGENKPLVKNNSSKNRQINRRVEFKILGE